jgi:hypothetical protein
MNMKEWLRKHEVSPAAYEWAVSNCKSMYEVWDKAKPDWLVWIAFQPGVLDDKTLKKFICWCIFQIRDMRIMEYSDDMLSTAKKISYIYEFKYRLGMSHARCAQAEWLKEHAKPNFDY